MTYQPHWAQCSVCKERCSSTSLVKYSVRRYAHPVCAMRKWGGSFFSRITPWQASRFPYFAAKDADAVGALIARAGASGWDTNAEAAIAAIAKAEAK